MCRKNMAWWVGGFKEVPEFTGSWKSLGPLHAWALTHCLVLA